MEGYGNENPGAFQPTRPLRGATMIRGFPPGNYIISTHAPLAGRDTLEMGCDAIPGISTHAPLAGRDAIAASPIWLPMLFQPTRPLRGATICAARR